MLLGKRPRGPMRRTTSMTGITVDLPINVDAGSSSEPSDIINTGERDFHATMWQEEGSLDYHHNNNNNNITVDSFGGGNSTNGLLHDQRFLATMVSPRNHHRSSVSADHFVEAAPFLRTCGLCKRRLGPGKDLYMYRGDTAFCSQECREERMKQDERKKK